MKKSYVLICLFLVFVVFITLIGTTIVTGDTEIKKEKDILLVQSNKEVYFSVYGYSISNPNVIVNPYGNSPLTAIIMFETNDYSEVEIVIKSKNGNSDIYHKFGKNKYHMIPIYGLYADYDNTVVIKSEGIETIMNIRTEKLPDDFMYVQNSVNDNFMFYNSNYPYAVDIDGEVRWYLNNHYFGDITFMNNSNIIIGSDKYNEIGNTISFYKMNLLGKIYNEYLLEEDYWGYSALYDDNILVLSDKLLLLDSQTGKIINEYIDNDGYDYLEVQDNNIIVGKNEVFYKVMDNYIEEIQYSLLSNKYSFYSNTDNYKIIPSERFGVLKETPVSEDKIALINYEKLNSLENISITREVNRIKVINDSGDKVYLILDKFMDKRVYEISDVSYINIFGLSGKYTIYFKINDNIYKTDYYVEV